MGLPAACVGADFEKAETSSYAPAFSIRIFLTEQIQRLVRFIAGGLDFDGTYLLSSGEQKIYFIEVPVIIREGMIGYVLVGKSKRNAAGPEKNCFPPLLRPELSDNGVHSRRVALELP